MDDEDKIRLGKQHRYIGDKMAEGWKLKEYSQATGLSKLFDNAINLQRNNEFIDIYWATVNTLVERRLLEKKGDEYFLTRQGEKWAKK